VFYFILISETKIFYSYLFLFFFFPVGPGPGRYALPSTIGFINHDFSKHTKPAYSFGRRLYDDGKN